MNGNKPTRYVIDVTWTADVGHDKICAPVCERPDLFENMIAR